MGLTSFSDLQIVDTSNAISAARLGAYKAMTKDAVVKWVYSRDIACAATAARTLPAHQARLVAMEDGSSFARVLPNKPSPISEDDKVSEVTLKSICRLPRTSSGNLIVTDSKKAWNALRKQGVKPVGIGYYHKGKPSRQIRSSSRPSSTLK